MNLGIQVEDQPSETCIIEDIDVNGYLESTNHSEKSNNEDVTLESNGEEGNDISIMGQVFDTPKDAYTFYNRYALLHGFGIRTHWGFKNRTTNEAYRKLFVCNKQGFKRVKGNTSCGNAIKQRRALRTGCTTMLRVSKNKDGKWFVDLVSDKHNHKLTNTPTKVMKHRSHGKYHRTLACKSLMEVFGRSGLRPCQVKKAVNAIKSPNESDVTSKQCADILSEQRKQYKGKEFYGLIKHFQDKRLKDRNQYFAVDLFDDGSPRNVFWADGRSRDAYTKFGDVVVFDVTYMTNKFKMPFAPFTGVNHHGQSIVFGGALLDYEKEETFQWLFEHFLHCMFDKYPTAMITDQDKAMGNAIKKVFPNTRHRFCAWHIKKHELEHLQLFKARYDDFHECYKKLVKSATIEEFESNWEVLRDKYNIDTNSWITGMYNQRTHWVKAFLNDVFFAGMTTTGRSESMNSFFDGFVNSKTMLNEFVIQYDKAVGSRRAAEENEDFKTMNTKPVLSSVNLLEEKSGRVYTRNFFEVFQKEWKEANCNLDHQTISKSTEEISYRVGQLNIDKRHWRIVVFRCLNQVSVKCSCAMYESYGILCKHSLYVLKKKKVNLPDHYILPRRTLAARHKVDNANIGLEEKNSENGFLENQMMRKKLEAFKDATQHPSGVTSQVDMLPQLSVRDPLAPTNTKGRPKSASRIKSSLELNLKKKRNCSYCQGSGHYATSCSKRKMNPCKEKTYEMLKLSWCLRTKVDGSCVACMLAARFSVKMGCASLKIAYIS